MFDCVLLLWSEARVVWRRFGLKRKFLLNFH